MSGWDGFRAVTVWDFEFRAPPGERPDPVSMVAHDLKSGRTIRIFQEELRQLREPPFPIGRDALCIGWYTTAEFGCHYELGWELPHHVLDLYTEFRAEMSGLPKRKKEEGGYGLLGAQLHHGLQPITKEEKQRGRALVMRGGPWSAEERLEVLDYCESDVIGTTRLFGAMRDTIDWPHARQRGREMKALAWVEHVGTPIDAQLYASTRVNWDRIRGSVIRKFDADYGVFVDDKFSFKLFADYLARAGIEDWPTTASGRLKSDDDTFKEASEAYPQLTTLRRLRRTLGEMRSSQLSVGTDGRNRTLLGPSGRARGETHHQPVSTYSGRAPGCAASFVQAPGARLVTWTMCSKSGQSRASFLGMTA